MKRTPMMIKATLEDSVVRNVDLDGEEGMIFTGPNTILHGVSIAPGIVIVNVALDEDLIKKHKHLVNRESEEEYNNFLAERKEYQLEAKKEIEDLAARRAAGELEIRKP